MVSESKWTASTRQKPCNRRQTAESAGVVETDEKGNVSGILLHERSSRRLSRGIGVKRTMLWTEAFTPFLNIRISECYIQVSLFSLSVDL